MLGTGVCVSHQSRTELGDSTAQKGWAQAVVQGRKKLIDTEEEKESERAEVSEKACSGSSAMYQGVTCNSVWFMKQQQLHLAARYNADSQFTQDLLNQNLHFDKNLGASMHSKACEVLM